jgi:hypothetical protein
MNEGGWQVLYRAAVLELDQTRVPERIDAALNAIGGRLINETETLSKTESDDIETALRMLHFLVRQGA